MAEYVEFSLVWRPLGPGRFLADGRRAGKKLTGRLELGPGPGEEADLREKRPVGLEHVEAGLGQDPVELLLAHVMRLVVAKGLEHGRGDQPAERAQRRAQALLLAELAKDAGDPGRPAVGQVDGVASRL